MTGVSVPATPGLVARTRGANLWAMPAHSSHPTAPLEDDHNARALRVREMLDRWRDEDVGDEPEWEVAEVAPLSFDDQPAGDHE